MADLVVYFIVSMCLLFVYKRWARLRQAKKGCVVPGQAVGTNGNISMKAGSPSDGSKGFTLLSGEVTGRHVANKQSFIGGKGEVPIWNSSGGPNYSKPLPSVNSNLFTKPQGVNPPHTRDDEPTGRFVRPSKESVK